MTTHKGEIGRSEPGRLSEQLTGTVWLTQERGKWQDTMTNPATPQRRGCDAVADYAGVVLVCHLGPRHKGWHRDMTDHIEWHVETRPAITVVAGRGAADGGDQA